jgi:hypothetical protein
MSKTWKVIISIAVAVAGALDSIFNRRKAS